MAAHALAGGRKTYWEKSCPKCGKPSENRGKLAVNRFGHPKIGKRAKCRVCYGLLSE
jgi:hypothetical protein